MNFLDEISIEGVDEEGRNTFKSIFSGDDRQSNAGGLKFIRKSELKESLLNKNRISIKGANQYEFILQDDDIFNFSEFSKDNKDSN